MNKLMDLIEEGDAGKILSEENLFERFNELLKYDLVVLKNEKVYLTKKGILAREEGIEGYLRKEKRNLVQTQYKKEQEKDNLLGSLRKNFQTKKALLVSIVIILISLLPYLKNVKSKYPKLKSILKSKKS